jgi:hypothetical protein
MAIIINDNYCLQTMNKAFDSRYLDINIPWASCSEAIAGIPTYRYTGLTINIGSNEYWWKEGIADEDLVLKTLGGTSNLTGATNGLQLLNSDTNIGLGGNLTQNTTICGAYTLNLGDSISGLTAISGVTPIFNVQDEGGNSNINFVHNQDTPHYNVCLYGNNSNSSAKINLDVNCFIACTVPDATYSSSLSVLSTSSNTATYNVNSINDDMCYIKEACIASSNLSCEALINKTTATDNIKTVMNYTDRSHNFIKDDSTILSILSGGTARYGSCVTLSNDCDLAYRGYVDDAANSISGSNGLTRVDDNITLGGTLTGNTCIDGDNGNYGLTLSGLTYFNVDSPSGGGCAITLNAPTNQIFMNGCNVCAIYGGGNLDLYDSAGVKQIELGTGGDTKFCNLNAKTTETNLLYINSSSGQLVTGTSISISTANNGLCKIGDNFTLGGDLTGNTIINGISSNDLSFNNINNFSVVSSTGSTCATTSMLLRTPSLTIHNGIDDVMLLTSSCNILTDTTNSEGFVYADDYSVSGSTNPRWIPDNAYVTGLTSGDTTTANNGLSLNTDEVILGGTLCENTNICLGGLAPYDLSIKNSGLTTCSIGEFKPTAINLCASGINSPNETGKLELSKDSVVISNGFLTCNSCISLTCSEIKIGICGSENSASFIVTDNSTTPKGIEYATDYSTTYGECSLITKKYVDNNSNVINVCHINSGYTTVRTDELVAISGLSTNEISLYATPVLGQRLSITDVCGNAFVDPIIVNGNGNNINDSVCSIINTDYGSVTYVYNGLFWSATAFIN